MNPADIIFDRIVEWLTGWAQLVDAWATTMIVTTIELLLTTALPTIDQVLDSPLTVIFGSTYALGAMIVTALGVFVMLVVLLSIRKPQGKRIAGLFWAVIGIIAFGILFRPLYGMAYDLTQGLGQGMLNVFTNSAGATFNDLNALLTTFAPGNAMGLAFVGVFTALSSFLLFVEAFVLRIAMLASIAVMPVLIGLKPLNKATNSLFHGAVSALVTCLFAPILMSFFLGLPIVLDNVLPGAGLPTAKVAIVLACCLLAFLAPLVLAFYIFRISKEVFGEVEARTAGAIDVKTMPPMTLEENQKSMDRVHFEPLRAMSSEVGAKLQHGDIFDDIKGTAVGLAVTGAAVAGHPWISAGIAAGDNMVSNYMARRSADAVDNGGGSYDFAVATSTVPNDSAASPDDARSQ